MSQTSSRAPLRVAIAGLGPKGLYAFERLLAHTRNEDAAGRISVDIYEPHPVPGAGPVYDPAQPAYLCMNFAAHMVDMWPEANRDPSWRSFEEWRAIAHSENTDSYPPRALVGRYLANGFERLLHESDGVLSVDVLREAATRASPSGAEWELEASERRAYDEVLVAVGHAASWDGGLASGSPPPGALVPAVFPVEKLSPDRVPADSVVAMRGFALTMIDGALALTEGRGGRFTEGAQPHLLRYEAGDGDVRTILPYSRTGRPMLAKPDPSSAIPSPELNRIATEGRSRLARLPDGTPLAQTIAVVGWVAAESLRRAGGTGSDADVRERLDDAVAGRATPVGDSPAAEIKRSIAVGVGASAPGVDWALGHAWRGVYPTLVERLGADGLEPSEWPALRRLATEMERISFGPPPVNAAKLVALIECGKVDLSRITSGPAPGADVTVDAVLPPPGAVDVRQPLLEQLIRDGHARIPEGRRGIELTPDVTCVDAGGAPSRGLGAIGRPTEDWVIGNDTLNRALHPHPELWARRIVARALA